MLYSSLFIALAGFANLAGSFAQYSGSPDSQSGQPEAAWHMDTLKLLAVERLDSIVSPNQVASHMHQIVGGSAMAAAYNYQDQIKSSCTSAAISADKSNYWMPKLYWINSDGTFTPLPARHRFYYFLARNSPVDVVQPFPEGLRMLVGNPNSKSDQGISAFSCIINSDLFTGTITQSHFNFDRDCPYGIRIETFFPNCWNGQDLYKSDGSHMAYPANTNSNRRGPCPWSHPIRLPTLMLEFTYLPSSWASGKATKGNLIWANGDTTGFGTHADFVNGWDTAVLTKALNNTNCVAPVTDGSYRHVSIQQCEVFAPLYNANPSCTPDKGQMNEPSGASVDLVPVDSLPGCNPVWGSSGSKPGCATTPPSPNVANWQGTDGSLVATGAQNKARKLPTTPGWQQVGCIIDSWTGMLTGRTPSYYDTKLEPKSCTAACSKQGFSWALMGQRADYRWDCVCGEGISPTASYYPGMCNAACPGNSSATCGGFTIHSVWYAPPGTTVDYQAANVSDPSYMGCYAKYGDDSLANRVTSWYNDPALTTASCLQTCANRNATWAVTTNGKTCACGSDLTLGTGYYVADSTCNSPCVGNSTQMCGYTAGYSLYNLTASSYSKVQGNHPVDWVGCYDDPGQAGLTGYSWVNNAMTPEMCTYGCADLGYSLAGVIFGNRCRCDNAWKGGAKYPASTCNTACAGNSSVTCGGNQLTELYNTTSATKQVALDTKARPAGWKGCYLNSNTAIFKDYYVYDGVNTVERCMQTCSTYGYTWGAVANQYYCRCTSTDPTNVSTNPKIPSNVYCTTACPGNAKETCGAPGQFLEAYRLADYAASVNDTKADGYVGCYSGSTGLSAASWTAGDNSVDYCTTGCKELGYALSSMAGQKCNCGNTWDTTQGKPVPDFQCYTACPGNGNQTCGGYQVSSVWNSSIGGDVQAKSQTGYLGCYADNASNRALKSYTYTAAQMTNANCKLSCAAQGYTLAATANGNQCFCGNSIQGGYNTYVTSAQCSTPCGGNTASQCGGPGNRISMFNATVPNASSNSTNTTVSSARGCYTDTNVLATGGYTSGYMTVDQCVYYCKGLGTTYAGLVQGNICRCGNSSPVAITQMSACDTPCVSNSSQTCGGTSRIQVWETSKSSLFVDPYKAAPGSMGCYPEAAGNILTNSTSLTSSALTQLSCAANCYARGAKFSASKGTLCYCGNALATGYQRQADSTCSTPCPGDGSAVCGGYQVVNVRAAIAPSGSASASASASRTASAGASASAVPSSAAIEGYKGCYAPGSLISSATVKYTNDNMNIGLCRRYCRVNGFGAAALSAANSCYCGQTGQLGTKWPDAACTLNCKGDATAKCGDVSLASVYDTVGQGARFAPGYPANYVGCFVDTNSPRKLPNYTFISTAMTADLCRRTCSTRGLTVYGTEYGNQCYCGSVQPLVQTFDANCNSACVGNATEKCGGSYKLSLYNAAFALDSYSVAGGSAASSSAAVSSAVSSKASAVVSPSASRASSAVASSTTSRASSAAASPSKASTAAASASTSKASSAASASKASSAASSPKASSAAASASSRASSAVTSQATASLGGGLAASPSPSPVASSSARVSSSSSAAASPSVVATSHASSAAASKSSATSTSTTQSASTPSATNHLGCYTQSQSTPVFKNSVITCDVLTPAMCKVWCDSNNYQYAGMTNGTTCGCSNSIVSLTQSSASTCSKACFSDTTAKCGGEPGTTSGSRRATLRAATTDAE